MGVDSLASNVRLKRIYDEPSDDDGYRVLITRFWPRGVKREAADEYNTKVAPSSELVHAFKKERLAWEPYVERYLAEMQSDEAQTEIAHLREMAESWPVTLLCMCEDETHCHRSLLRDLILKKPTTRSHKRTPETRTRAKASSTTKGK
jgi:uncharacterized protein YeaO (DUF488 family)